MAIGLFGLQLLAVDDGPRAVLVTRTGLLLPEVVDHILLVALQVHVAGFDDALQLLQIAPDIHLLVFGDHMKI